MEKICEKCGKSFSRPINNGIYRSMAQWKKQRFCSRKCTNSSKIGNVDTSNKLSLSWKKNPKRKLPTGKDHWQNKEWVKREKTYQPKICEWCKNTFIKKITTRPADFKKQKFCSTLCRNKYASSRIGTGQNHHAWKGGKCGLNEKVRKLPQMKDWREKIFKRDDYTCQFCKDRGGQLHSDHKKALAILLIELGITTLKQARHNQELWNISNGQTLCVKCHEKTDTYGGRTLGRTYHTHIN